MISVMTAALIWGCCDMNLHLCSNKFDIAYCIVYFYYSYCFLILWYAHASVSIHLCALGKVIVCWSKPSAPIWDTLSCCVGRNQTCVHVSAVISLPVFHEHTYTYNYVAAGFVSVVSMPKSIDSMQLVLVFIFIS